MSPVLLVAEERGTDLLEEVLAGLRRRQKRLPCKLFYDEAGARLFERICGLREYYPTRTEITILRAHRRAIAEWIGPGARIVEFGSGSGEKTRILLHGLERPSEYVPIDIAHSQILTLSRCLAHELPGLQINPVCADYSKGLRLAASAARTVVFIPGSTIGNFEPHEAIAFLRNAAAIAGPGGGLLIGVDLRKERTVLERAYNDTQGVTAGFNRNILRHVNRVCDADFDPAAFGHYAFYDESHGRIEMHLTCSEDQIVTVGRGHALETRVTIRRTETILTEYSYKYEIDGFHALTQCAGFGVTAVWQDRGRLFSLHALEVL